VGQGLLFDGGGLQFETTPGGPVRLGQYQRDLEAGGLQLRQRHPGKFGCTSKN
jgi:hypothetical protein